MSSHGSSSKEDKQPGENDGGGKLEACKRKRNQISILEYFSKRKKAKKEEEIKDIKAGAMNAREETTEAKERREVAASAAERRLGRKKKEEYSLESSGDEQGTSSSLDVDLSQSLFGGSPKSELYSDVDLDNNAVPVSFNNLLHCGEVLPKLQPLPDHRILVRPHIQATEAPQPYPDKYRDIWDKDHVKMPCSRESLYPTKDKTLRKRWDLIKETLAKPVRSSKDFEDAILKYNVHYKDKWNFEGWHSFCNHYLPTREKDLLFHRIIPEIAVLALKMPSLCTQPPPLLKRQKHQSITLSQQQAACLLANAFFCTFPRRNAHKNSEYSTFPDINFNRLFRGSKDVVNKTKSEKLKTLLNYFRRVTSDMPVGTLTYTRKVLGKDSFIEWERCDKSFRNLYATSKGTIEDDGNGFLQVDFANRLVGGGVIGEGCVQEEIRFLICPELILSRLFVERLDPNETLLVRGAERFSDYTGYAQTYTFRNDYIDLTPRDRWGRLYSEVVAMDAHIFHTYSQQFAQSMLKRELNKAHCAFQRLDNWDFLPAVATGNWGCGAFGGDARLKALIQLMAAAVSSRDLIYFTFGDTKLCEDLRGFHSLLLEHRVFVSNLWRMLLRYERELKRRDTHIELYPYLKNLLENPDCGKKEADGAADISENAVQDDLEADTLVFPGEGGSDVSPDYRNETP